MRDLQVPAHPCNALVITRNEQVSGSRPLVGSPFLLQMFIFGSSDVGNIECLSAVRQQ